MPDREPRWGEVRIAKSLSVVCDGEPEPRGSQCGVTFPGHCLMGAQCRGGERR